MRPVFDGVGKVVNDGKQVASIKGVYVLERTKTQVLEDRLSDVECKHDIVHNYNIIK